MQHPGKSHLITISDWADAVTALMRRYLYLQLNATALDDSTSSDLAQLWTMDDSVRWVSDYIDDAFNCQMEWARDSDASFGNVMRTVAEKFGKYFPDVNWSEDDDKQYIAIRDDFICQLDPVVIMIDEFVTERVQPNPWYVWHLHFRYDLLLVEPDEDYRIKIFNDKIASGEWKL